MTTKNIIVCRKNPSGVGQPAGLAVPPIKRPMSHCMILYVSGFATRKNTKAE